MRVRQKNEMTATGLYRFAVWFSSLFIYKREKVYLSLMQGNKITSRIDV